MRWRGNQQWGRKRLAAGPVPGWWRGHLVHLMLIAIVAVSYAASWGAANDLTHRQLTYPPLRADELPTWARQRWLAMKAVIDARAADSRQSDQAYDENIDPTND